MAVLIVMMMAATVFEKLKGTGFALQHFYYSPVFIALWAVAAVSGLIYLFKAGVRKQPATLGIHLALSLMLVGAFVTHVTGRSGMLHLRLDEGPVSEFISDADETTPVALPFEVSLQSFEIEFYKGSHQPSDYVSEVTIGGTPFVISMNHIAKKGGYRFFQADYDEDMHGSILAVSHDPWGTGITYAGYLLLALCMLGFFFQKDTAFRRALKRLSTPAAVALLLLLPGWHAGAAQRDSGGRGEALPVLPKEVAAEFGDLCIYYKGRVCPLQTMAREYTLKAYGKARYGRYSAEQVVTGWLFYYDWWRDAPMKIKAGEKGKPAEYEKQSLPMKAATGQAFDIFPIADSTGKVKWYNSGSELPAGIDHGRWLFVRKTLDLMRKEVEAENWAEVSRLVSQIRKYQDKVAADVIPAEAKFRAEKRYNAISRPMVPFMASITAGIILFLLYGIWTAREKRPSRKLQNAVAVVAAVLFAYLTIVIALRWYVSGNGPFVGSYSIMMLMAWVGCLLQLCLFRRLPLIQPLGFLLSGFTMLMASLASANPRITNLMPVLQSPLLSVHVLSMMISYTLFGLVALNGIMGLFMKEKASQALADMGRMILYPAVFLITFGTFIGAVWANISWGSYWAWDPKETWALITLLIYSFTLHGESAGFLQKPKNFHLFTILAFLSVLVTYFGVNLLLGGMHSYA